MESAPTGAIIDNQSKGPSSKVVDQLTPTQPINNGFSQPNQFQDRAPYKKGSYIITDLAWLVNQKMLESKKMTENETGLCIISYNSSFSNLRFSLRNFGASDAASRYFINLEKCLQITTINFGSETAFELLDNFESGKTVPVIERLFKANTGWSPNKTNVTWNAESILLETSDSDENHCTFIFTGWQMNVFKQCLHFMTDGRSWSINLQTIINKLQA